MRAALETRLMAVAADDPEQVFGWLFGGAPPAHRLDYVYVKPIYRRLGVARALLSAFGPVQVYTHAGELLLPDAEYNPYLLYNLPPLP